jgi:Outer membrane protein beta-barrel domain
MLPPKPLSVTIAVLASLALGSALPAQSPAPKSRSLGIFAGAGVEAVGLTSNDGAMTSESGSGAGLVLGYGLNSQWALYSDLSSAAMTAAGGGRFTLRHLDAGTRVHFGAGTRRLVPFLQVALGLRALSGDVDGSSVSGSSAGVALGGGVNVHLSPAYVLSAMVNWATGNVDIDSRRVIRTQTPSVATWRAHLGVLWYAR